MSHRRVSTCRGYQRGCWSVQNYCDGTTHCKGFHVSGNLTIDRTRPDNDRPLTEGGWETRQRPFPYAGSIGDSISGFRQRVGTRGSLGIVTSLCVTAGYHPIIRVPMWEIESAVRRPFRVAVLTGSWPQRSNTAVLNMSILAWRSTSSIEGGSKAKSMTIYDFFVILDCWRPRGLRWYSLYLFSWELVDRTIPQKK